MRILHYVVKWLWTSDSFVYGPIARSRHQTVVGSAEPVVNTDLYPHEPILRPLDWKALDDLGTIDLVHAHHGYGIHEAATLAGALSAPLVCSFWGYDVTALPRLSPGLYDPVLGSVSTVIVPSRYLASVVGSLGFERDRICIVPGSVDTDLFRPTPVPTEPRVAFIGRFVEKKGIGVLLQIWDDVRRHVPGAELHLLGYGDDPPTADEARNIHVHIANQSVGRQQVRDLIASCRVYVAPSRTAGDGDAESQHIGNLEAQASGRPVLTTDNGGIPEFVDDGRSAIVVSQNDPTALRSSLVRLLLDLGLCNELGRSGRVNAMRYDVAAITRQLDGLYERTWEEFVMNGYDLTAGDPPKVDPPDRGPR